MVKTIVTGVMLFVCLSLYSAYLYHLSCKTPSQVFMRCSFAGIVILFILSAKLSEWIECSNEICKDIQRVYWFSLIGIFVMQILHYGLHITDIYQKLYIFNGAIAIYAIATISASVRHERYK